MTDKPVRVFVHAGFHKTGTTSLQSFLRANQRILRAHYRYYGKSEILAAGAHARIYAQRPFVWRLWRFARSFRLFLNNIDDFHTIILSRETLSGGMPGHRKIGGRLMTTYQQAAPALAKVICAELRRRFGPDTNITFVYTTRKTDTWIKSVHGHLLRSIRLCDDLQKFKSRFQNLKGPTQEAADMAAYLHPLPVMTIALEEYAAHTEGPAAALLDSLDIPHGLRKKLKPAERANIGQTDQALAQFLTLNQTGLHKRALKAKKEAVTAQNNRPETA